MKTQDFHFQLPEERIARHPADRRDASRLLVLDKETGVIQHQVFSDFPDFLEPGDLLVLNNTRVFAARLLGTRPPDFGKVEALLLEPEGADRWRALVRPGKKIKIGQKLVFKKGVLQATVLDYGTPGSGERILHFEYEGDWWETLEACGHTPLPPYILKARKHHGDNQPEQTPDRERYQTVYANQSPASVAAPTAGLHFTNQILDRLEQKGVRKAFLNLHVGAGTFQPIKTDTVEEHPMHREYFDLPQQTRQAMQETRDRGGRIIAIGTTVVRALETAALVENGQAGDVFQPAGPEDQEGISGWTQLLIAPEFPFQKVDALLTNFHLPCSSLLLLVSAFARRDRVLSAYQEAIEKGYRFYSYGDCMFLR